MATTILLVKGKLKCSKEFPQAKKIRPHLRYISHRNYRWQLSLHFLQHTKSSDEKNDSTSLRKLWRKFSFYSETIFHFFFSCQKNFSLFWCSTQKQTDAVFFIQKLIHEKLQRSQMSEACWTNRTSIKPFYNRDPSNLYSSNHSFIWSVKSCSMEHRPSQSSDKIKIFKRYLGCF